MKDYLIKIFYKYYFLIEKKYFKISDNSQLKYSKYIYHNYSCIDIL